MENAESSTSKCPVCGSEESSNPFEIRTWSVTDYTWDGKEYTHDFADDAVYCLRCKVVRII